MQYTDELKKKTAIRLKRLRKSKKNNAGKYYSHATLAEELTKQNDPKNYNEGEEYRIVSSKSLAYYEVVNKGKKFDIGKGMKVSTLFMLATFYNVSCDYLLGLKDNEEIEKYNIDEVAFEMGLDSYSKDVLLHMMKYNAAYKEELLTINNVIHSFTSKAAGVDENSDYPSTSNTQDIEQGFLYMLSRYLFYTSRPQRIKNYPNMQDYDGELLSEDELANLLLIELQKLLQISRDKHKSLRRYPLRKFKRLLSRRNDISKGDV